jgi:hypothetical protein
MPTPNPRETLSPETVTLTEDVMRTLLTAFMTAATTMARQLVTEAGDESPMEIAATAVDALADVILTSRKAMSFVAFLEITEANTPPC